MSGLKVFNNSQMGRYLILCPIRLDDARRTVVYAATSHLESPVAPHQGGKADLFGPERKQQLRESLQLLDDGAYCRNQNVVFAGDMNWREPTKTKQNDGDMKDHLPAQWVDCWERLRPGEDGFTYNAKANGMLTGYLRNRLDRVLFKENGTLKLKSIEMVGTEPIPNLSYSKKVTRHKKETQKVLPVLPSDHFGLLAKFEVV